MKITVFFSKTNNKIIDDTGSIVLHFLQTFFHVRLNRRQRISTPLLLEPLGIPHTQWPLENPPVQLWENRIW